MPVFLPDARARALKGSEIAWTHRGVVTVEKQVIGPFEIDYPVVGQATTLFDSREPLLLDQTSSRFGLVGCPTHVKPEQLQDRTGPEDRGGDRAGACQKFLGPPCSPSQRIEGRRAGGGDG